MRQQQLHMQQQQHHLQHSQYMAPPAALGLGQFMAQPPQLMPLALQQQLYMQQQQQQVHAAHQPGVNQANLFQVNVFLSALTCVLQRSMVSSCV